MDSTLNFSQSAVWLIRPNKRVFQHTRYFVDKVKKKKNNFHHHHHLLTQQPIPNYIFVLHVLNELLQLYEEQILKQVNFWPHISYNEVEMKAKEKKLCKIQFDLADVKN